MKISSIGSPTPVDHVSRSPISLKSEQEQSTALRSFNSDNAYRMNEKNTKGY